MFDGREGDFFFIQILKCDDVEVVLLSTIKLLTSVLIMLIVDVFKRRRLRSEVEEREMRGNDVKGEGDTERNNSLFISIYSFS